jgi:hypothetical protein
MATRRSNGEGGLSWNKARQRWVSSSLRKVSHSETWGQMKTSAAVTSAEVLTTDGFALPAEFNIVFERAGEVTVRLDFQSGLVKRVALEVTGDPGCRADSPRRAYRTSSGASPGRLSMASDRLCVRH